MTRLIRRRTFSGRLDQVAAARAFVREAIEGCPLKDDAILLTSELCTNAVQHSRSGVAGAFAVTVSCGADALLIEVRDQGSGSTPVQRPPDDGAENGRGMGVVRCLAHRWGQRGDEHGRTVYFELRWDTAHRTAREDRYRPQRDSLHAPASRRAAAIGPVSPAMRSLFRHLQALEDAIVFRRARIASQCAECSEDERCDDHGQDVKLIAAYHQDAHAIVTTITEKKHCLVRE